MFQQQLLHLYKMSLELDISKQKNAYKRCHGMRELNRVWTVFAVIKALFSNRNDFELIMHYIQTSLSINK